MGPEARTPGALWRAAVVGAREVLGDTREWEWRRRLWSKVTTSSAPPARFGHGLVWEGEQKRMSLFGGPPDYRDSELAEM